IPTTLDQWTPDDEFIWTLPQIKY
ncbi:unnamed protein product, partial [Rotaria magnacalcarata]